MILGLNASPQEMVGLLKGINIVAKKLCKFLLTQEKDIGLCH